MENKYWLVVNRGRDTSHIASRRANALTSQYQYYCIYLNNNIDDIL